MTGVVEVVGVHEVAGAREPVHLIEVLFSCDPERVDFEGFTQPTDGPDSEWQVAYDERWIGTAGDGRQRAVFLFHYLDLTQPLHTPFGPVTLPPVTRRPLHLSGIEYEAP